MKIRIIGEPQGKGRPRFTKLSTKPYTPKATKDYEQKVARTWKLCGGTKTDKPIGVMIQAYFSKPKQMKSPVPSKKPDADNIAKVILDGLNGVAYEDDKQVIRLMVCKDWAIDYPCVTVEVVELG